MTVSCTAETGSAASWPAPDREVNVVRRDAALQPDRSGVGVDHQQPLIRLEGVEKVYRTGRIEYRPVRVQLLA